MHRSGPGRKKDENVFSDIYIISTTVFLVHSTAYVRAHILNFIPVMYGSALHSLDIKKIDTLSRNYEIRKDLIIMRS